jgi:8-oxo-dGTP pyrophosphatase MutT (NUDIX family)
MPNVINDGYEEAVVFVFIKENKLLIEKRDEGKGEEVFFPNGGIEESDKDIGIDYRIAALNREVREEMDLEITDFDFLMDLKVDEIKVWFYVYVVTRWNGEVPSFTVEPPGSGQKFADLEWIDIKDYEKVFKYDSAKSIARKIIDKYL